MTQQEYIHHTTQEIPQINLAGYAIDLKKAILTRLPNIFYRIIDLSQTGPFIRLISICCYAI